MTAKQRRAINNTVENGGNISKAMRDAGYSPNTAKNPKKLTESNAWNELLEEILPDEFLLTALHQDIANNPSNRKSELELAFKITNRLSPRLSDVMSDGPVVFNVTRGITYSKAKQGAAR